MSVFDKMRGMVSSKKSSKKSPDDFQKLQSQCDVELLKSREKLAAVLEQNKSLQQSLGSKNVEIDNLRSRIDKLEQELNAQVGMLSNEKSENDKLRHRNLNLQDENELLVGRSSSVMSKLICFCRLLKTMDFSSIEECIAAIKGEIEKSSSDLGFDIMDTCGGVFNPKLHCIVDTKETDDILLNNHIADVVRPGIWYNGRCLIPQDVIIYTVSK